MIQRGPSLPQYAPEINLNLDIAFRNPNVLSGEMIVPGSSRKIPKTHYHTRRYLHGNGCEFSKSCFECKLPDCKWYGGD